MFMGNAQVLGACGFRSFFPDAKGRLVLEDLPKTIKQLGENQDTLMEAITNAFLAPRSLICDQFTVAWKMGFLDSHSR